MLEAGLVLLASFAFNLWRCAPGVTTGDAGELAAVSSVLGVAHAPGYPLYALAGKAFGVIMPFGAWTHRMNVLCALLGAGALSLLTDALRRNGFGRSARLGAAAVLGSATAFQVSTAVTEVFSLHVFLACLLLWVSSHENAVSDGGSAAVGLVFGLALGNHHTTILILPALLMIPGLRARSVFCAALGTVAGLSVYAYVPIRASASPPLDWGHATTLESFLHVLLRKDYGSLSLTTDGGGSAGLPELARQAARGVSFLGALPALLAAAGAALWPSLSRLPRRVALAWLLAAGPGFLMLGRPAWDAQTSGALERFALLPLVGAALLAAAALQRLGPLAPVAAAALAVAGLASPASSRQDHLAHDYGRALLDTLPRDSVFVMDGGDDTFYSLSALRWAHGLRPDLTLHDRGGVVFPGLYGPDFRRLPREDKERRRREVEGPLAAAGRLWYSTLNMDLLPGRELAPAGLLRRPLAPGSSFPEKAAIDEATAVRLGRGHDYRHRALAAFVPYSRGVAALHSGKLDDAVSWLSLAGELAPDALWLPPVAGYALGVAGYRAVLAKRYAAAEAAYRSWLDLRPDEAEPRVNLGVALERQGRGAEAESAYREAARRAPGDARPWAALGALEWSRGRWAEAAEAFEQAAARQPSEPSHAGWAAAARRKLAKR